LVGTISAVGVSLVSILGAIWVTKRLGEEWAWVNRKVIHFSIVPAILFYYIGAIPPVIFAGTAFAFGFIQLLPHLREKELNWYQIRHNYGEVFFAFSASAVSVLLPRGYATALLLVMAVSDGVTGIIRHYYFTKHGFNVKLKKHWTGSLGYFLTALPIALWLLDGGIIGKALWAAILMLAEYQRWLDDNLAVPAVGSLLYFLY
jgi:phytol kinase